MNRAPRIDMSDGQGLGIAATLVHRPREIEYRPGRDLAVAAGKDVRQAGRYRIPRPAIRRHGADPDSPDRYVARGGVKGKVRNRPSIPIPARAVGRTGADGDRPADGQIVLRNIDQRVGQCALAPGTAGERLDIDAVGADGEVHRRVVHHERCRGIDPGTGARNP